MASNDTVLVHITRQDTPTSKPYEESFEVPNIPGMNIISVLQAIRRNPTTVQGKRVQPVSWDCNCLEEVCGACTALVNGTVRQMCAALIDNLETPLRLGPMSKFPVVRDLIVDRQQMFDNLIKAKAWSPIDGTHDLGPGPRMPETERQEAYWFAPSSAIIRSAPIFEGLEPPGPGSASWPPAPNEVSSLGSNS